ncbi:MAG: hypothetical protein QOD26_1692 [Betaproteobacteria bacterium]|jgi:hypothetical protein|nr:hypothetical protein [Betaproteobacteria bacterium]
MPEIETKKVDWLPDERPSSWWVPKKPMGFRHIAHAFLAWATVAVGGAFVFSGSPLSYMVALVLTACLATPIAQLAKTVAPIYYSASAVGLIVLVIGVALKK